VYPPLLNYSPHSRSPPCFLYSLMNPPLNFDHWYLLLVLNMLQRGKSQPRAQSINILKVMNRLRNAKYTPDAT
jgi:hypothetical protein